MRTRERVRPADRKITLGRVWMWRRTTTKDPWILISITPHYSDDQQYRILSAETCQDDLHPGPPYIKAGSFLKTDFCFPMSKRGHTVVEVQNALFKWLWVGAFIPAFNPIGYRPSWSTDISQVWFTDRYVDKSSLATGGYVNASPLKPRVSLSQDLAEIRDLPDMVKSTAKYFRDIFLEQRGKRYSRSVPWYYQGRNTASQWLNYNFGWVPFLSTCRDALQTTLDIDKIMARLEQHNGKWEGRSVRMLDEESSVREDGMCSTSSSRTWPTSLPSVFINTGTCEVFRKRIRKVWFTAKYKYWLPELLPQSSVFSRIRLIRRLYGLELSPSLLYDLIPYSWLTDWFTGLGDIIKAQEVDEFGQLVTKNACLMDFIDDTYEINCTRQVYTQRVNMKFTCSAVRKQRKAGLSPFGFDVPLSGLSLWQTSILGALGYNRLTNTFKR